MPNVKTLEIKTADELTDPEMEERWTRRRSARQAGVLHRVLRSFVERGGPIPVRDIEAALADQPRGAVRASLAELDAEDLIQLSGDQVEIAYPFSAAPTAFVVRLAGGQERFVCCAIDALGIAPMLGESVQVRSRCHHGGSPLDFSVTPQGPGSEARDIMVWVGERGEGERRVSTGL